MLNSQISLNSLLFIQALGMPSELCGHVLVTERIFSLQQYEGVKSRLCIPALLARILRLQMMFCHSCTPGVECLFCIQGCVSSRFKRILEPSCRKEASDAT